MSAPSFDLLIPANKVSGRDIDGLLGSGWRIVAAALYLRAGLDMPPEVKTRGLTFGYCDARGEMRKPDEWATHFGWSVRAGPMATAEGECS